MTLITFALATLTFGALVAPLWQRAVSFVRDVPAPPTMLRVRVTRDPPQIATASVARTDERCREPVVHKPASRWERFCHTARRLAGKVLKRAVSVTEWIRRQCRKGWLLVTVPLSPLAHAQASPFSVGAAAVLNNFLVIFTPIAVVAVMAVAIMFWFNRLNVAQAIGCVVGIVVFFGAPQMVAWVRAMFGV